MKGLTFFSLSLLCSLSIGMPVNANLESDYKKQESKQQKMEGQRKADDASNAQFCQEIKRKYQFVGIGPIYGGMKFLIKNGNVYSYDSSNKHWRCNELRGRLNKVTKVGITEQSQFKIEGNNLILFEKLMFGGTHRTVVAKKR